MYIMKVIKKEQQQTSNWSGGTTTQLAIYPFDASYTDRNFLWRLSTAVVEVEESSFTKLQGFDRHLMVLEGELKLVHQEHHTIELKQYEQDSFKGGWDTTGYGKARDFNLMLKEGCQGALTCYQLTGDRISLSEAAFDFEYQVTACYSYIGEVYMYCGNQKVLIKQGEIALIEDTDVVDIMVQAAMPEEECILVAAFIQAK